MRPIETIVGLHLIKGLHSKVGSKVKIDPVYMVWDNGFTEPIVEDPLSPAVKKKLLPCTQ